MVVAGSPGREGLRRFLGILGLSLGTAACAATAPDDAFRGFAREMAERHGFDAAEVRTLLAASERRQDILDAVSSPAEALPWHRYRPIFMTDERIRQGVEFWDRHADLLQAAAGEYGVPESIIVAILGVETRYGNHAGRHRVIDALRTLAFDYPPRGDFFRRELEHYLLLAREEGFDPLDPQGSYAGAMGMPQFISSSYREYAVDFNDNGRRDLWSEPADAVGSVANYFRRHGWREDEPVAFPAVALDGSRPEAAGRQQTPKPDTTVGELRSQGVRIDGGQAGDDLEARLLVLEGEDGDELWAAFHNFYVITRYNHSPLYAMAVYQLSRAIAERRGAEG